MPQNKSFILLDAARMGTDIETAKKLNPDFISLFRGKSEEPLETVAPYLFSLDRESEFARWFFEKGWGNAWGVIFFSPDQKDLLLKHFQQILFEKTLDGRKYYFRFYDPRVLRKVLPAYDRKKLTGFFGGVETFICEDEYPAAANEYSIKNNTLSVSKIPGDQVISYLPVFTSGGFSV